MKVEVFSGNNKMTQQMEWIYKMSWYHSDEDTTSHTDMYYKNAKDVKWASDDELCRVYYICVQTSSNEYKSAVYNSSLH